MESPQYMMRDIPQEERPRERMMEYGAGALSHAELLAILLRTGTRQESAVHMAQRIQLKASIELGHRIAKSRLTYRTITLLAEGTLCVSFPE